MEIRTLPRLLQLAWCEIGPAPGGWSAPSAAVRLRADAPVEYADPAACAALATWAAELRRAGHAVEIDESLKGQYAWKCGLLSALAGRFDRGSLPKDHLIPVSNLRSQEEIQACLANVRPLLHLDEETAEAFVFCLSELLRNVFEHSGSLVGAFVSAAYFPQTDRATLVVADAGMTVQAHVKQRQPRPMDDRTALRIALEPGVTGSHDLNRNAGLGLYMTRRIASLTGGKFWILSGDLAARSDNETGRFDGKSEIEVRDVPSRWRGTVVALTLHPKQLNSFQRALREASAELAGGTFGRRVDPFRKRSPDGWDVVVVPPDAGSIMQDKISAEKIRREAILPHLRAGRSVAIELGSVTLTTQSAMHALLAEPLRELQISDVGSRLVFVRCSGQVKEVIRMVIGYVFDERATVE